MLDLYCKIYRFPAKRNIEKFECVFYAKKICCWTLSSTCLIFLLLAKLVIFFHKKLSLSLTRSGYVYAKIYEIVFVCAFFCNKRLFRVYYMKRNVMCVQEMKVFCTLESFILAIIIHSFIRSLSHATYQIQSIPKNYV